MGKSGISDALAEIPENGDQNERQKHAAKEIPTLGEKNRLEVTDRHGSLSSSFKKQLPHPEAG
jgi:hypothetical protein